MKADLHIETGLRGSRTILASSYFTPPFKLADLSSRQETDLRLMIMNSSPGVMEGDEYSIQIKVEEGTSIRLETQAFQRLLQMKSGALQTTTVCMQKGSSLVYIPHPSVPHQHSVFTSVNAIRMDEDCSLVWGEILTCGRHLNGEVFHFTRYQNTIEIFLNDRLVMRDHQLMEPLISDPRSTGFLEGYTHQASLICYPGRYKFALDLCKQYLAVQKGIDFGWTSLQGEGILFRLLGYKGEQLFSILKGLPSLLLIKKECPVDTLTVKSLHHAR